MLAKKYLVMTLVGVFILAGALTPYAIHAAQKNSMSPERGPGMMTQQLTDTFGVSQDEVSKYLSQHVNPRELMHAAMLSKASGKSLSEVLQMKTLANTWQDVDQSLGVTPEQLRALHQDIMATQLEKKLSIPKQSTLDLLQQGYHPHDIVMANVLSQKTQKPVNDVLGMKKINNNWVDVANELGIDKDTFQQEMKELRGSCPEYHQHGNHWGHMGEKFGAEG